MAALYPNSTRASRGRLVAALFVTVLLCVIVARPFRHHAPPEPAPVPAYADSAECATCHKDIASTYAKTGMGRSFSQPSSANTIEDFTHANTFTHQPSGMHYQMIARNGEFYERRSQAGPDGHDANVMEQRIDYIVGSGNHSRSYIHRAPDGQLIELPVSWYSEHNGYWAMSPGYDFKAQQDFTRAISPECMFCHNGYPQGEMDLSRSIFPAKLPNGVDCQRCHGPGLAHIQAARARNPSPDLVRSTIVNPAHLDRDRQLEVCYQCHMETSHHEPNEERAFNRTIFSFRPGESIADYKLYFEPVADDEAAKDDTFEIAHAAYRLRKSACFLKSQMTCLTCHDPHEIPHGTEAVAHYVEVCLNCHRNVTHSVALPAQSTCISCHMPKRRTEDAVHVVMTDHFIRRTQPAHDLLATIAETQVPEGSNTKVALYYPESPQTPAAEISIAEAQVNDHGITHLQALLDKYLPNAPDPYLTLAKAYQREDNQPEVAHWSQQALLKRPNYRPAIILLVPALFALHRDAEATTILEQAIAKYPTDDVLLSDLGNAYLRQGRIDLASTMLNRAIHANPDRADPWNLLGMIAARQNDLPTAEHEFSEAIRLQPNNADAHHNYGRVLVLMDQIHRALAELREAAELDPANPEIRQDLTALSAAIRH
jgi:Flp pilus assembly protein TadD/formate-dependent nitrite reductase cytochrome c552 subunit